MRKFPFRQGGERGFETVEMQPKRSRLKSEPI
jgi:hypothetical protein